MRYLLVGDLHCKRSNLEESERLLQWIWAVSLENQVTPIFMGDLYDEHAIAYVEVFNFLYSQFQFINERNIRPIVIMGNHDANLDCSAHWLKAHAQHVDIIDTVRVIYNDVYAIPFRRNNEDFVADVLKIADKAKIILCHQEFIGAHLTDSFYSSNGVDLNRLPKHLLMVSGHIHKSQKMYRDNAINDDSKLAVFYIGASRQFTRNDVGQSNQVILFDLDKKTFTSIAVPHHVCKPHLLLEIREDTCLDGINFEDYTYVDIYGTSDFISRINQILPPSIKVRSFIESTPVTCEIKESDGINVAFQRYLRQYQQQHQLSDEIMHEIIGLITQKCPILKI